MHEIRKSHISRNDQHAYYLQVSRRSADNYESSGWQLFRTATRLQSGLDALEEWRLVMTHFTVLGITEILWSFRLVLEGKTDEKYLNYEDYSSHKTFQPKT